MLGATYLARVSASFIVACTQHTFANVVIVIRIAAFVSWYDWNLHILQVVWQLGFALKSEGKNTGSVRVRKHQQSRVESIPVQPDSRVTGGAHRPSLVQSSLREFQWAFSTL